MDVLVDTNVLVRRLNRRDPQYRDARAALKTLSQRGDKVCIVAQNIIELWSVCTRPTDRNGFGLSTAVADRVTERIEASFQFLPETHAIYTAWREIVVHHAVSGLKVHDARLVAAAVAHGVKSILTFNGADFRRYAQIEVLDPSSVAVR